MTNSKPAPKKSALQLRGEEQAERRAAAMKFAVPGSKKNGQKQDEKSPKSAATDNGPSAPQFDTKKHQGELAEAGKRQSRNVQERDERVAADRKELVETKMRARGEAHATAKRDAERAESIVRSGFKR